MADKTRLPRWDKGSPITAADLNRLAEAIESARVEVDSSGGLIPLQTPNGLKLSLRPPTRIRYAEITTECPAYSTPSSVKTLGKGVGTIYALAYSTTGVCTLVSTGATGVAVYNPGNGVIAVGRRVQVHLMQGQWHVISDMCPA